MILFLILFAVSLFAFGLLLSRSDSEDINQEDSRADGDGENRTKSSRKIRSKHDTVGVGSKKSVPRRSNLQAVSENKTVVLRRQIPITAGIPPRSWLGGKPFLPNHIEWPRSRSSEYPKKRKRPLHFVAQIACRDLPKDLWGGLGPRDGWLLLFVDPNCGSPDSSNDFRIIHTDELGLERDIPDDLGPVHDGVYSGPTYAPVQETPRVWRRWPIDLVTFENEITAENGRVQVAPCDFEKMLYDKLKIGDRIGDARSAKHTPFLWGMVKSLIVTSINMLDLEILSRTDEERTRKAIMEPSIFKAAFEMVRDPSEVESLSSKFPDAKSLLADFERTIGLQKAWKAEATENLNRALLIANERGDLEPISLQEWQIFRNVHKGNDLKFTKIFTSNWRVTQIHFREVSLSSTLPELVSFLDQTTEMYLSEETRSLVPKPVMQSLQPYWSQLIDNRPHRMGGYHDGLQSEAQHGPASELLLFQVASDPAMHWAWGDNGAYFFWIKPQDLAAKAFNKASISLECH